MLQCRAILYALHVCNQSIHLAACLVETTCTGPHLICMYLASMCSTCLEWQDLLLNWQWLIATQKVYKNIFMTLANSPQNAALLITRSLLFANNHFQSKRLSLVRTCQYRLVHVGTYSHLESVDKKAHMKLLPVITYVHVMLFIEVYLIAASKYRWLDRGTPWIRAIADRLAYPQNLGPAAYCGIFPMTLTTLISLYDQCQHKTADPTLNDQGKNS